MIGDRPLYSRRRGLSPRRLIAFYAAVFLLVSFHQAGRVAQWYDDLALAHQGAFSQAAFQTASFLHTWVEPLGPAALNTAENRLLASLERRINGSTPTPKALPLASASTVPLPPPSNAGGLESQRPAATPSEQTTKDEEPEELLLWAFSGFKPGSGGLSLPPAAGRSPKMNSEGVFNPGRVLLLGDSMMLEGFGPQLQRRLSAWPGLSVSRTGRYGTGLCRLDVFDWLHYFDLCLIQYQPDLVILTVGANDTQDIVDAGHKRVFLGSDEWNAIYADRVRELLRLAEMRGVELFWVGLPIMGREPYTQRVIAINKVAERVCQAAPNCRFWDSWLSVADAEGRYSAFLRDEEGKRQRVRAQDGVHLTEFGGGLMAEKFLSETAAWADYRQSEPAAETQRPPAPSAGEAWAEAGGPEPAGRLSWKRIYSTSERRERSFYVAEPVGKGEEKYPLVLLLHGAWDEGDIWVKRLSEETLTQLAQKLQLILVMPNTDPFGWYADSPKGLIETFLIKELLPQLRAWPQADGRRLALAGLSMGGHGALSLALKYPELFSAVSTLSAITDISAHAAAAHPVDPQLGLAEIFGPPGPQGRAWQESSALGLSQKHPQALRSLSLRLAVGLDDGLTLAENRAYHQVLTSLGLEHRYVESPGGHNWDYWADQLPEALAFLAETLREKEAGL